MNLPARLVKLYTHAEQVMRGALARLLGLRLASPRAVLGTLRGVLLDVAGHAVELAFHRARTFDRGGRVEAAVARHVALRAPLTAQRLAPLLSAPEGATAEALARLADRAAHRGTLIAATELTNMNALATVGAYHQAGHGTFAVVSTLDERTTATCHAASSLILDPSRALHRHACPACHYGCRSFLVPSRDLPSTDADVERMLRTQHQEFPTWTPRLTHLLGMVTA